MVEMLLQSHNGEIALLPALPDAWKEGSVKGLKARGNFEIAIDWKNNRLVQAQIVSLAGGICRIRTAVPVKLAGLNAKAVADAHGYTVTVYTEKGKKYTLSPL
jgi:alpha-L-fucosidase 2